MNETPSLHDIILPHSRVNEWEKDALLENLPNKEVDVKETKSKLIPARGGWRLICIKDE